MSESDVKLKRIVIDVLKPREISLVDLSKALCEVSGTNDVAIVVKEVDANTETISITIEGKDIDFDDVIETIEEYSCAIRSIDEIEVYKAKPI
ncbi:MAG: DUF211 domain-containing protein [archaeon GB-1867-005]|nr:DUF211 domain-containing protein [Candidatus Culexmicrobium cathedralense]